MTSRPEAARGRCEPAEHDGPAPDDTAARLARAELNGLVAIVEVLSGWCFGARGPGAADR